MASGPLSHVGLGKRSHELLYATDWTRILNNSNNASTHEPSRNPNTTRSRPRYEALPSSFPELEIKSSPGRGLGIFAIDAIPAYTCILVDDALLSISRGEDLPQIWEKYSLLSAEQRASFDALAVTDKRIASLKRPELISKLVGRGYDADTAEAMARTAFKFQSNAFKTGAVDNGMSANQSSLKDQQRQPSGDWAYAIFPTVARVNHSCTPNAHGHYRAASGQQVLFSLREIAAGEELEISYLDLTLPRQARQTRAQDWGFRCECPGCSTPEELQISTRSRSAGRGLARTVSSYEENLAIVHECCHATTSDLRGVMRSSDHAKQIVGRYEEAISIALDADYPWLRTALPKLYDITAQIKHLLGDDDARLTFSSNSREWARRLEGKAYT